jgi:predicted ATPase/DNA-binding SARP family transcriptional activator/class 3 adenylate cyclase
MNDPWRITLFGSLRAERGEQIITRFKTQKVASLFAYLAFYLRQTHSREILIELLWPESNAPTLRNSLSVALSSLRNQFEPPGVPQGTVLRADRFSVGLNPATVTTDVAEFEQALKAAARADSALERTQHLTRAVELYHGPLLPGFYEAWILGEQERLSGLFLDAVGALVSHLEGLGDTRTALSHARHAVAVDPYREEGQQHLIRLLAADGQPGAALRQYREYERLLEEEMGEEPSASLHALFRQIEKMSGLSEAAIAVTRKPVPSIPSAAADPSGGLPATMTFLMTDIEGSTRLFQKAKEAYTAARERHHALLRQEFARYGGQEVKETGDGFVLAFPTAGSALACAVAAQQALALAAWPEETGALQVRMALHTGDVERGAGGQYHGIVLHHTSRMLTAAHGGQILVSEVTAGLTPSGGEAGIRFVDLGVYRLRDVPEAKRLFQVEYPHMAQKDFGPLAAEAGHKAHVPPRFTRFFGREEEITQLQEMLLTSEVRLVTVTGPGGTGKTRLSLEVAERLAEPFAGAVYFVALADLSAPTLLAGAVLDSLRVPRAPQQEPLEQAIEALSAKPTLLVLDNFEHLVEGGADIVQTLLTRISSLKLLTTSRQLLGLSAEREFALQPLPTPAGEESPEQLSLYESVQLFIDRAQQVMPHFQVSNVNAAAVAALVGGLEGIPLAIELAAARVQVLTPAQMLSQLSRRFDFLASRKRDIAERQRTLRGALEWSYRLLVPELQHFFSRLSVFRGGWSLEAAEEVCEEPLALDYLEQLRECSLVLSCETDAGAFRFRMLETLREYGQERLAEGKETDAIRNRHLSHFLALAEESETKMQGPEQSAWLDRLETEHDNLRAAMDFGAALPDDDLRALQLAGALRDFWHTRGYLTEGERRLESLLRVADIGEDAAPDRAAAGARAWYALGLMAFMRGREEATASHYAEALTLARRAGDLPTQALTLLGLAYVARDRGDLAEARRLGEESLALRRQIGDVSMIAWGLIAAGHISRFQGDWEGAGTLYAEALALFEQTNGPGGIGYALNCLGHTARSAGRWADARAHYRAALAVFQDVGFRQGISFVLGGLAGIAAAGQDPEDARRAARLIGAVDALREGVGGGGGAGGAPPPPPRPGPDGGARHPGRGGVRPGVAGGPGDDARAGRAVRPDG